jgi:hypothetical protein
MDMLHRWVSILAAGQLAPKSDAKNRGISQLACIAAAACLAGCEGTFGPWQLDGAVWDPEWSAANCGLAIQGEYAAVCGEDDAHHRSVTVFSKDSRAERWVLLQRIAPRPGAPEAKFGEALALDHGRLAIGAVLPSPAGSIPIGESLGYVDVYKLGVHGSRIDYGYEKTVEAFADRVGERGYTVFASELALSANTLVVAARLARNGAGRAFVFDLDTNEPPEALEEHDGSETDYHFGHAVDAAAGRIAIAAEGRYHDSSPVFVYHRDATGNWIPEQVLSPEIPADPNDFAAYRFGTALALFRDWLVVADKRRGGGSKIFLFARSGERWLHSTTYEASGVYREQQFAGSGELFAVADQATRSDGRTPASRIRIFRLSPARVELEAQILMPSTEYGSRIDISPTTLIVSNEMPAPTPPNAVVFAGP